MHLLRLVFVEDKCFDSARFKNNFFMKVINLLKRILFIFFSCIHVNLFVNCYIKGEGKEETYVFEFILIFEC